jgi:mannose-1-phosphate guanylyltransferase
MKAVLMAGGEGTRLRPITLTRPKPFVPVGGKPCIEYVLASLHRASVRDVMVTTYYKPADLVQHLGGGERYGMNLAFSIEDEARGTAGGVRKVAAWLDDTFVVASGDVFADFDLKDLVEFHRTRGALATMALTRVENPSEFGIVGTNEEGRITRFKEKPRPEEAFSNLINAGIYVLERDVLDMIPEGRPFDFSKDLFPTMLAKGDSLFAKELAGTWVDIGRPSDLIRASRIVTDRAGGVVRAQGATISPKASLRNSSIHAGAVVGENAVVEESILLDGAKVEPGAVVRRSFVGAEARVAGDSVVEDSVVGDGAVVEGHAVFHGIRVNPGSTARA